MVFFSDCNDLLDSLKQIDPEAYARMTYTLSPSEQTDMDELNRKKPNAPPKNVNPVYTAKVLLFNGI